MPPCVRSTVSDWRRQASPSGTRRAARRRNRCRGRARSAPSSPARLLAAEVEQILRHAPDLHLLGALGDAVAAGGGGEGVRQPPAARTPAPPPPSPPPPPPPPPPPSPPQC